MKNRAEKNQRIPVNFRLPVGLYKWAKRFAKLNEVTVTHLVERGLVFVKEFEYGRRFKDLTTARPREAHHNGPDPKVPKNFEFKLRKVKTPSGTEVQELPLANVYGVRDINKPPKNGMPRQLKGANILQENKVFSDQFSKEDNRKSNGSRKIKK